jgi:hypothetical protein
MTSYFYYRGKGAVVMTSYFYYRGKGALVMTSYFYYRGKGAVVMTSYFYYRGKGAVVMTSSGSCSQITPQMTVYAATKVRTLTIILRAKRVVQKCSPLMNGLVYGI